MSDKVGYYIWKCSVHALPIIRSPLVPLCPGESHAFETLWPTEMARCSCLTGGKILSESSLSFFESFDFPGISEGGIISICEDNGIRMTAGFLCRLSHSGVLGYVVRMF